MSLKWSCTHHTEEGYYEMTNGVEIPVQLFLSPELFASCEESIFPQIQAATQFPGVKKVIITPDVHQGYVVPVGCVMATEKTLCQAPVGYDIGCGMMAFKSTLSKGLGYDHTLRQRFSERVMETVGMGAGQGSGRTFSSERFNEVIRTGANALHYRRENVERDFLPVDDTWDIPDCRAQRGITQLGSLGGGNHFIELQHDQEDHLWVMVHTGSRGFGHGLASHFIQKGKEYLTSKGQHITNAEAVYFEPGDPHYTGYRNAVHAGANFAIANRLLIWESVGKVFQEVFGQEPELVYEISHNLVQEEEVPGLGKVLVHRKGATRAFPGGHPYLKGTKWETTGHPILIPGSMGDHSYILFAEPGAEKSLYSVNHGCGRKLSRSAAKKKFTQEECNAEMASLDVLVNGGGNVPIDESPGCYKDASQVIESVVAAGLARVAYTLTPIASHKGLD